jgi:hypothetical protein
MHATRLALLVLVAVGLAASGCKRAKPVPRDWSADPEASAQLGDEVSLGGYYGAYRIRPPAGYVRTQQAGDVPGVVAIATAWSGERRPDGTAPSLMVMIATAPPNTRHPSLEEGLATALESIRKRRTNWSESTPERGRIDGVVFLKATWSGNDSQTGRPLRGFVYWTIQSGTVVQIGSQDIEPHDATTLPVADAAALTLRFPTNP